MEENQNQVQPQVQDQATQTQPSQTTEAPPVIAEVPEESVAMPKKSIILFPTVILLIVASVFAGSLLYQNIQLKKALKINSFEECSKANGIIQESYPPVCVTKDGRKFTAEITPQETKTPLPTTTPEEETLTPTPTSTSTPTLKPTPKSK